MGLDGRGSNQRMRSRHPDWSYKPRGSEARGWNPDWIHEPGSKEPAVRKEGSGLEHS